MPPRHESDDSPDAGPDLVRLPRYSTGWDRDINVYNITELPVLVADGDPGSEDLPLGLKVLREFCLEAAAAYAWEVWFDFAADGADGQIDACWSPPGKGTCSIRLPRPLMLEGGDDLGVFGHLLKNISDEGMFAIHATEFKDSPHPKHNPFDERGRLVPPPPPPPEDESETPGIVEMVTIRAFRLSLKGHSVPEDLVIQICPRFWHMPTGFEIG